MGLNVPAGSRIAFDTPVLVYFLEHHPQFYKEVQQLFERMEGGDIHGVLSSLALTELLVPAFRMGQADKAHDLLSLLSGFPNLDILNVTTPIAVTAPRLAQYPECAARRHGSAR
ncbi:MAG: type II toxin-antitoxin system VapC family toxin [Gammaproteobacteria bacterium]